ncbi:hypothetical protein TURU_077772 [Turdus rufiventris]|nr:hypothetical protein TURU_077772 [Turdus rufiventris]
MNYAGHSGDKERIGIYSSRTGSARVHGNTPRIPVPDGSTMQDLLLLGRDPAGEGFTPRASLQLLQCHLPTCTEVLQPQSCRHQPGTALGKSLEKGLDQPLLSALTSTILLILTSKFHKHVVYSLFWAINEKYEDQAKHPHRAVSKKSDDAKYYQDAAVQRLLI